MEFIEKYAGVEGSDDDDNDKMSVAGGDEINLSDEVFIDNETNFEKQAPSNYCLTNFTRDFQEAVQDYSMAEEFGLMNPEPQNFVPDCINEVEFSFDEFDGFEKRIKKFEQDLKIYEEDPKDSFFYAVFMEYSIPCWKKKTLNFLRMKRSLWKFLGQTFSTSSMPKRNSCSLI